MAIFLKKNIYRTFFNTLTFYRNTADNMSIGLYKSQRFDTSLIEFTIIEKFSKSQISFAASSIYARNISQTFDQFYDLKYIKLKYYYDVPLYFNFKELSSYAIDMTFKLPGDPLTFYLSQRKPMDIILYPYGSNYFAIDLGKSFDNHLTRYIIIKKVASTDTFLTSMQNSIKYGELSKISFPISVETVIDIPHSDRSSSFYDDILTSGKIYTKKFDLPLR